MRIVMEKVDLHVHSTYSDGTKTPKELIEIAEKEGLSAIALTDHDTLDGIPAALAASDKSYVFYLSHALRGNGKLPQSQTQSNSSFKTSKDFNTGKSGKCRR